MKPAERREALERARLYLVAPGEFPSDVLGAVIGAGVDLVQLRMKDSDVSEILEIGEQWMGVCEDCHIPLVVNDRPDVALALGADGVHLGQEDLPPFVAREIVGRDMLIGRSTHSQDDIARGVQEHEDGLADYIAVGPIWETPTGPGKPATGLQLVAHAASSVGFPWFGIGGIDTSNIGEVVGAGATRVVVVRAITLADDPVGAVGALRGALP